MKAIKIGTRYEIYGDSLQVFDQLPAKTYTLRYGHTSGFYLEERPELSVKEKVYGTHMEKAGKVLRTFACFDRNLGVILSGEKGIGKSLFARVFASKAVAAGYPVIVVDRYHRGITDYIESIDQEVVFLFDEYDKTVGEIHPGENEVDPQATLLSLFDGMSQGKKLFIITCNNIGQVSQYLVNRPGRFHYHFRFDYPSPEEVRTYLRDKLGDAYDAEIEKAVMFSRKTSLNYDCLRAIAFELGQGEPFEEAIQDLNIVSATREPYNIMLHFKGGSFLSAKRCYLDLFDYEEMVRISFQDDKGRDVLVASFRAGECAYDIERGVMTLPPEKFTLKFSPQYTGGPSNPVGGLIPEYMSFDLVRGKKVPEEKPYVF